LEAARREREAKEPERPALGKGELCAVFLSGNTIGLIGWYITLPWRPVFISTGFSIATTCVYCEPDDCHVTEIKNKITATLAQKKKGA
jgi:hypothetical protein